MQPIGKHDSGLKHIPYADGRGLFSIALERLPENEWLEVDGALAFYLDEKERLADLYPGKTFMADTRSEDAQAEALSLIIAHLKAHHGETHRFEEGNVLLADRRIDLGSGAPPLLIAARLVQEDLIIMRKGEDGWQLSAAALSFPSSWSLQEKFGKPMHAIHKPVPGFGPGTRNAMLIERIFDNLLVDQPVRRMNWSVYSDGELFHDDRTAEHMGAGSFSDAIYLRVEYQTLRKMPRTGDILFTVRIHVDPFERLARHPDRADICERFIATLREMTPPQLAYKGLTDHRDALIAKLDLLAKRDVA